MNAASLSVAICGVVLASLSLSWQAATYVLSGGRVKVLLRVGAMGNGGVALNRPTALSKGWAEHLSSQGFTRPVVAITVANVGRQPVTVERWGLGSRLGASLYPPAVSGPSLPRRLDVGESQTWTVDAAPVQAFIEATRETLGHAQPDSPQRPNGTLFRANEAMARRAGEVFGIAELADGRRKRSKDPMF